MKKSVLASIYNRGQKKSLCFDTPLSSESFEEKEHKVTFDLSHKFKKSEQDKAIKFCENIIQTLLSDNPNQDCHESSEISMLQTHKVILNLCLDFD